MLARPESHEHRAAVGVGGCRACGRSERRETPRHERRAGDEQEQVRDTPTPHRDVPHQQYRQQRADERAEDPRVRAHVPPIRCRAAPSVGEPHRRDDRTGQRHAADSEDSRADGAHAQRQEQQGCGPEVELLLDRERPHVLQRAVLTGRIEVRAGVDEVPVGDVRKRRRDVGAKAVALDGCRPDGSPGDHRPDGDDERGCETADTPHPEPENVQAASLDLNEEEPGDDEPAEDEEDVHAEEAGVGSRRAQVEGNHGRDCERPKPVQGVVPDSLARPTRRAPARAGPSPGQSHTRPARSRDEQADPATHHTPLSLRRVARPPWEGIRVVADRW